MKIAFDIDDTLWKVRQSHMDQVPDYDLIQVLRWFHQNGDDIYFWSAGGMDYCQMVVTKLGLNSYGQVAEKGSFKPDIAFDDQETSLGKVDVRVKRVKYYVVGTASAKREDLGTPAADPNSPENIQRKNEKNAMLNKT